MALSSTTLRPGFLVSLKTSMRGNVSYIRKDLEADKAANIAVDRWETERRITNPEEHAAARKARSKAQGLVRSVCSLTAFGLLCPEIDAVKLEVAISGARDIIDAFNASSELTTIGFYVLTGKVSPDDVEAVRAINSEISELMAAMGEGVANGNVDELRAAASRVKSIGNMLSVEAQTKVEMAVTTARAAAKAIVKDKTEKGANAVIAVDKTAIKRIEELRMTFLDLDEAPEIVATSASVSAPALDLSSAE